MSALDRIIRERLFSHPEEWSWNGPRFLDGAGIHLVKSLTDNRWTYVVGEQRGYIKLSWLTHSCIELSKRLRDIPDQKEEELSLIHI